MRECGIDRTSIDAQKGHPAVSSCRRTRAKAQHSATGLLYQRVASFNRMSAWGGDNAGAGRGGNIDRIGNGAGMSESQILQQQDAIMRQQDDVLGDISRGVGNLKVHAQNIGQEADMHVRLLDEMEGDVGEAQDGLQNETDRATRVRKSSSNCKLYICIIFLFVVLIILLVSGN